jgi:hypothetical protein
MQLDTLGIGNYYRCNRIDLRLWFHMRNAWEKLKVAMILVPEITTCLPKVMVVK